MAYNTGSHTKFNHKFHVVWVTKCRYKVLKGEMRVPILEIIRQTCSEMGVRIEKGVLSTDHGICFCRSRQIGSGSVMHPNKHRGDYPMSASIAADKNHKDSAVT